ncbi:MAG: NAD(P)-binding protein [Candidatus Lokiarchaeota archaeon]|nr:NAD(P)-binding protein [Candidatus Lokiarchaeota archaeon]MBD3199593.1 NAD(P)-binding protein [Candidatus Lokiarchaeota archaeon]
MTEIQNYLDSYNVIVVGAGLAGLGAACQLGLANENVLLLEKHNVPGGFATSFVRGRFEFEGALHMLSDIGTPDNPGALYRFFRRIGLVPEMITFKNIPEYYRTVYYDGYDEVIPYGVEKYFNKLLELFHQETEGIEIFREIAESVYDGIKYIGSKRGNVSQKEILKNHPWIARVIGLTLQDVFEKCFNNKRLISVISQPWGFLGLPPSRVSAYAFLGMTMTYLDWGGAYPVGRSHALSSAMAKCFRNLGGDIRFNAEVEEIIIEKNLVEGVRLTNGDLYKTNAVISNVNPITTSMKLINKNIIPDEYKKKIYAPAIGPSGFSVYIGLNAISEKLGLQEHETFINIDDDLDAAFESFHKISEPKYMVAACYNNIDNSISPPGTSELVLTTLQMGDQWQLIPPDQYHQIKDDYADKMLKMVEKTIIPNIRDYIEIAEVATPLTYYRYSNNFNGAIYGYHQDVLNSPMMRLKSNTPIKNLYQAGAWTNFGGGFSTSILGGRVAAGLYLKNKKEDDL